MECKIDISSITPSQWLETGLNFTVKPSKKQRAHWRLEKEIDEFKSAYGPHPCILGTIWLDLQSDEVPEEHRLINPTINDVKYFLLTARWLRKYETWSDLAKLGGVGLRRLSEKVKKWVLRLAALKELVVVWPTTFNTRFIVSIDGTHCHVNEPRDPDCRRNKKNYSHKFHKAGVNYEIGVSIFESRVIHAKCQS